MSRQEEIERLVLSEPADLRVPHILTYRRRAEYITHFLKIDDIKAILLQEMSIKQKVYQQITHKLVTDGSVAASEVFLSGTLLTDPDPRSFRHFISILREHNQDCMADELMKTHREMEELLKSGKPIREEKDMEVDTSIQSQDSGYASAQHLHKPVQEVHPQTFKPATQEVSQPNLSNLEYVTEQQLVLPASSVSQPDQGSPGHQIVEVGATASVTSVPDSQIPEGHLKWDRNSVLGKGRCGNVCEGIYKQHRCAVKELAQFKTKKLVDVFVNQNREILGCCSIDHASIVKFFGYAVDKLRGKYMLALVFELVDGVDLDTVIHSDDEDIRQQYNLDLAKKYDLARKITEGVEYIHRREIIHRDIKPANVLLADGGQIAKLCDLGLCKMQEDVGKSLSYTQGPQPGTLMYMAYEIIMNQDKATKASDIHSLGATLFELFQGEYMWGVDPTADKKELKEVIAQNPLPPKLTNLDRKQPLSLIALCVQREPNQRPTASQILVSLQGPQ